MEKSRDALRYGRERTLTSVEEWFDRRDLLSHDVIKNRVMVAFGSRPQGSSDAASLGPYLRLFVAREQDFHAFVEEAPFVLQPGSWLAGWMGTRLGVEAAGALSEFLNMDFHRTSSLPGKFVEVKHLLEQTLAAACQALESESINADADPTDAGLLIRRLSDEFTALPSTMLEVVESMK